ncbi:hypothetical protein MRX96_019786 [Rhipicephalus microplus]
MPPPGRCCELLFFVIAGFESAVPPFVSGPLTRFPAGSGGTASNGRSGPQESGSRRLGPQARFVASPFFFRFLERKRRSPRDAGG